MSFSSLQLSSSESWLVWLVWIAVAACVGGVFILVGLVMEKYAGRQPSFTIKSKAIENRGEILVIVGVALEIISTGAFAIRGEIEIRHINEKEAKAVFDEKNLERSVIDVSNRPDLWLPVEKQNTNSEVTATNLER